MGLKSTQALGCESWTWNSTMSWGEVKVSSSIGSHTIPHVESSGGGGRSKIPLLTILPSWVVDISFKDDVTVILFLSVSFMANKIQSALKSIHEKHFKLLKALYLKINLNVKKYKTWTFLKLLKFGGWINCCYESSPPLKNNKALLYKKKFLWLKCQFFVCRITLENQMSQM